MADLANKCSICGERAIVTFCRRCGYRLRPTAVDIATPVALDEALAAFYTAAKVDVAGPAVPPLAAHGRPPLMLPQATPNIMLFGVGRLHFMWRRMSLAGLPRQPWWTVLDWVDTDSWGSTTLINEGTENGDHVVQHKPDGGWFDEVRLPGGSLAVLPEEWLVRVEVGVVGLYRFLLAAGGPVMQVCRS